MGCITSTCQKSKQDDLESSGPLHFDKSLEEGAAAPYLDKLSYSINAYVVSVYDGDTFTIAVHHHLPIGSGKVAKDQIVRVKCRVNGIDTPEMRPLKSQPNRDAEIVKAKEAKKFVEAIILNKHVKLHVDGLDKYGRWLVRVACPDTGKDVGEMVLEQGHGYRYNGGTKQAFSEYSKI